MVRFSQKQLLLDDLQTAVLCTMASEARTQVDFASAVDSWHPNINSDESDDDDGFDYTVSRALLTAYSIIDNSRYSVPSEQGPQRGRKLIDILDQCAGTNRKLYRGLVRMPPEAFQALTQRLSTTNAFHRVKRLR